MLLNDVDGDKHGWVVIRIHDIPVIYDKHINVATENPLRPNVASEPKTVEEYFSAPASVAHASILINAPVTIPIEVTIATAAMLLTAATVLLATATARTATVTPATTATVTVLHHCCRCYEKYCCQNKSNEGFHCFSCAI
jgi:hypothetical protein